MSYYLSMFAHLFSLLLPVAIGLMRLKYFDKASRYFFALTCVSLSGEAVAYYAAFRFKANIAVYSVLNLIEVCLLMLYFNYCIKWFARYNFGFYLIPIVWVIWLFNLGLTSISVFHSIFLLSAALMTVGAGMISMTGLLMGKEQENIQLRYEPHFWLSAIVVLFWTFSFVYWGMYDYFTEVLGEGKWKINVLLVVVNIVTNIGYATVFFKYPKMTPK